MSLQHGEKSTLVQNTEVISAPSPKKKCIIITVASIAVVAVVAAGVAAYFSLSGSSSTETVESGENIYATNFRLRAESSSVACSDAPPPTSQYSCEQQKNWGKCTSSWMEGYCCSTCGGSSSGSGGSSLECSDVPPPSTSYTCEEQKAFGKCDRTWMQGYCCKTCHQCQCGGGGSSPSSGGGGAAPLDATTLHWNSHRPCATENTACVSLAQQSLANMVTSANPKIVGTVELANAHSALSSWSTSGQFCDYSAIMVAPGWQISKSNGGCFGNDQNKGFAVALVKPPQPVRNCPSLCVMMGHYSHPGASLDTHDVIENVCGGIHQQCMIAMGDWNRVTSQVGSAWSTIVGGSYSLIRPEQSDQKTCCYPDLKWGLDHTVTNIAGASSEGVEIFPWQLSSTFPKDDQDEHRPVSVKLRLPTA